MANIWNESLNHSPRMFFERLRYKISASNVTSSTSGSAVQTQTSTYPLENEVNKDLYGDMTISCSVAEFLRGIIGETSQKLNIEKINCRNNQQLKTRRSSNNPAPNVKQFPWQSLFRRFLDGCPQPEAPGKATLTLKSRTFPNLT